MADIKVDVNLGISNQKIVLYNLKALQQIFQEELGDKLDKKSAQDVEDPKTSIKKDEDEFKWRRLPSTSRECMIIASGGECQMEGSSVVPKQRDNTLTDSDALLLRRELDVVQEKMRQQENCYLVQVCADYSGVEMSRDYYMEKIKQLMTDCKQSGIVIWYTGHGERRTGNWCFKDGVISFEDIFALYMDHFRGKGFSLVCDCSYSGSWVEQCAKKLDEIGIPSCGHHTREQGILIKVFCSCKDDQMATMLVFCEEGTYVKNNSSLLFRDRAKLNENQQSVSEDFAEIRCRKEEECEVPAHHTWMNRLINGAYHYIVRGTDGGKPAWHCVLIDKEKKEQFMAMVATGTVDVAHFGQILCSGWGKDPPEEKKRQLEDQFMRYLKRE